LRGREGHIDGVRKSFALPAILKSEEASLSGHSVENQTGVSMVPTTDDLSITVKTGIAKFLLKGEVAHFQVRQALVHREGR
jgi:hypothetical protein